MSEPTPEEIKRQFADALRLIAISAERIEKLEAALLEIADWDICEDTVVCAREALKQ